MVTKKISLKIWENNYIALYANQGEVDSRYVEVSFKDQDQKNLDLTNKTVTFYASKPDGTKIFNDCSIETSENTATVKLTSQTLSAVGIVDCEFQIFNSSNTFLKISGLKIIVSAADDFSDSLESTSEFNTLIKAINDAENFSGKMTDLYFNESGTNGTITLSDSAANYDYLEIYYCSNDNDITMCKVCNPNGKIASLSTTLIFENKMYQKAACLTISEKSITWLVSGFATIPNSSTPIINSTNNLRVVKVVGYK